MVKLHVILLFLKSVKTILTYYVKIILYFTLFLKIVLKEQRSNNVKNFEKSFPLFKI